MENHPIVQHIPRLRRYARALAGDRYAADDLVQDTLERAWNKFHLWRPGSDLRAWLFAIMHNVFVNQMRSRRLEVEQVMEDPPSPHVRASQADAIEVADLERALSRLTYEHREVLLLVAVEQMKYEEVASTLGIPVGTVMSRLSRARERLRQQIDGGAQIVSLKVVK
jgi:RNA polymerase sigma-70 factor (ECF subfamily)